MARRARRRAELGLPSFTARALLVGGSISDGPVRPSDVLGLRIYRLDGRERFRLFDGERAYVAQTSGPYAYVYRKAANGRKLRTVVDVERGVALRTDVHDWRMPLLLPRR